MRIRRKLREGSKAFIAAAEGMLERGTRRFFVEETRVYRVIRQISGISGVKTERKTFWCGMVDFKKIPSVSRSRRQISKRILRYIRSCGWTYKYEDGAYWITGEAK